MIFNWVWYLSQSTLQYHLCMSDHWSQLHTHIYLSLNGPRVSGTLNTSGALPWLHAATVGMHDYMFTVRDHIHDTSPRTAELMTRNRPQTRALCSEINSPQICQLPVTIIWHTPVGNLSQREQSVASHNVARVFHIRAIWYKCCKNAAGG